MTASKRPLENLAALVTGGGSGIGLACARALVRDGATVTIAGRTDSRLREGAQSLEADRPDGVTVEAVVCDVTDEDSVIEAVRVAATPTGRLDIVVANAGGGTVGPIFSTTADGWRHTLEVNLTGTFLTLKHAAEQMKHSGGGSIVAMSSIAGVLTHRFFSAYCASKAGVEMLVRTAADELGAAGIRVNAVRPGLVPTELASPLAGDATVAGDYLDQMPIRRLGEVDDIAAAVRYLAGPESSWVTGQCLAVDGGHTLRRGPRIDSLIEQFLGPESLEGLVHPDESKPRKR